ncbi:MAG: HD domain-containing phosphohydrolase [Burkholderiales bacterium]|jgi:PAS domain S-box-containing protein/putative nucleotidyltransferase with HDIG domain
MPDPAVALRVLIVEDSEDDALLLLRELRRAGYAPESARVDSAASMRAAFSAHAWDIILSDYMIPGFGGLEALKLARESGLDLPFVLVSNKVSEETLVEAMRAGAMDFLMKDRLDRLGPVVKRELADAAARRAVRQAQFEWKTAFDAVQDAIFIHDARFCIVRANLAYAALAGMPAEQIVGKPYWEVFPRRDGPLPGCSEVLETGGTTEACVELEDGKTFASRAFAISDALGKHPYSVHVLQDITERNRVQEALAQSERHFRSLLEHASDIVAVVDRHGLITYISPSVRQLGGYETDDLLGKSYLGLVHPEDAPAAAAGYAEIIRNPGALRKTEFRFPKKDGTWTVLESVARNALADPLINGIVINSRDVTERRRGEVQLKRLNWALRALGQSNSALVHAGTEDDLFRSCCEAIAGREGYPLAWIGLAQDDAAHTVKVAAAAGAARAYMQNLEVSWGDTPLGRGPTGTAIRSGVPQVAGNMAENAAYLPWLEKALANGLAGSISLPIRTDAGVIGALVVYSREADAFGQPEVELFEELAADIGYGVSARRTRVAYEAGLVEREQATRRLRAAFESLIAVLASTVERRDPYTAGHQRRVAELASAIARTLGLNPERIEGLHFAATIHDIGKIYVPAEILSRPGKLPATELELVKTHAQVGFEIVKDVEFPWHVADMIRQHHERLDGSGYPQGLKGDQILLEARILAVADVVEAMSSHRPYRPGLGIDAALAQIRQDAGSKLDLRVVEVCERLFREQDFAFSE